MTKPLIFFTIPQSRGRVVRWMLEETGADYETEILEYDTTLKGEPYLSVNPMGKVPAIKHGDKIITECAAICAYLADAFPDANLAPPPDQRADYYRWLFFTAGPAEQGITNKAMGFEPAPEQRRSMGYGNYDLLVDVLEQAVSGHSYVAGDTFSAADVYIGSQIGWGLQFGTLPERPAFAAYVEGLFARPARVKAMEIDDALLSGAP